MNVLPEHVTANQRQSLTWDAKAWTSISAAIKNDFTWSQCHRTISSGKPSLPSFLEVTLHLGKHLILSEAHIPNRSHDWGQPWQHFKTWCLLWLHLTCKPIVFRYPIFPQIFPYLTRWFSRQAWPSIATAQWSHPHPASARHWWTQETALVFQPAFLVEKKYKIWNGWCK